MKRLTEKMVEKRMRKYLETKKWNVKPREKLQGVDIYATDYLKRRQQCYIECKGEPSRIKEKGKDAGTKIKSHNTINSQRRIWVATAIAQIISRMENIHSHYGIALPDNEHFRKLVTKILPVRIRSALKMHVYFIKSYTELYHLTPSGKKPKHEFF